MKTTKTKSEEVILCDDCKKNETEEECGACKKDLCLKCNAWETERDCEYSCISLICKDCFDKFPKFVQENINAVLRRNYQDSGNGEIITLDSSPRPNVLNPDSYKHKGFYIFIEGHEDGSCVWYCKNKEEILEALDEYSGEENEDMVSDVYDEQGNVYEVSRTIELTKK